MRSIDRRARLLLGSPIFDEEFYSALRGRDFATSLESARDCVDHGLPDRLTPHPFLDFLSMPSPVRRAWRQARVGVLLRYLENGRGEASATWGPLDRSRSDAAELREDLLERARAIGAGVAYPDSVANPVSWSHLMAEAGGRVASRVSIIVSTRDDSWMTLRAARMTLKWGSGHDIEVVVVDKGSRPHIALALASGVLSMNGVRLVRLPHGAAPSASFNRGLALSTGRRVIYLRADTVVRRGWLPPMLDALDDPEVAGVQPLLLDTVDMIRTAGTRLDDAKSRPERLLEGHPKEDADSLAGVPLPAVTVAPLLMRAEDIMALGGFQESYSSGFAMADLCLRALDLRAGGFRLAPSALATETTPRDGLDERSAVQFAQNWAGRLSATRGNQRSPHTVIAEAAPPGHERLRWSISLPSTPGVWGDDWGDTHFGEALGRALRRLGQDAVTRRQGAYAAGPTHLDDVNLAIRGRSPIPPRPSVVNVMWVISHPDSVDPAEFDGYDHVFAASHAWSAKMAQRSGRPVVPLLQATEIDPQEIAEPPPERVTEAVFVGNTEGRRRPLVDWAISSGIPLAVHGRGWKGQLPDGVWRSEYVPPDELPALYRRHGLVLADHWPDMATNGFVSNRVFDAIASGAVVVTDQIRDPKDGLTRFLLRPRDLDLPKDHLQSLTPLDSASSVDVAQANSFVNRAHQLISALTAVRQ